MDLNTTNRLLAAIPSSTKVQTVTAADTIDVTTDIVLATGTEYTVTLPASAEAPNKFIAFVNCASGTVTVAEPTNGAGAVAFTDLDNTTGTIDLIYSTGLGWIALT